MAVPVPGAGPIPVVVHLSGKLRGTTERLSGSPLRIGTASDADVHFPADGEPAVAAEHAVLEPQAGRGAVRAAPERPLWVNGEPVESQELASGDMLEIGRGGPLLRFRLYEPGSGAYKTMSEAFSDCVDCARYGADGTLARAGVLMRGVPHELATQTAPWFRAVVALALVLLTASTIYLAIRSWRLERRLEAEVERWQGVAALLAANEEQRLTAEVLESIRREMGARLEETAERLATLERRAGARRRVIAEAARSVAFLQGAYGFIEPVSGKPLRFVGLDARGRPLTDPLGNPQVSPDGAGPVVEALVTGTGFVATREDLLLTNRHVAEPWRHEPAAQLLIGQGLRAQMLRFVGYLPGMSEPFALETVAASEQADVALLHCSGATTSVEPLELAPAPPAAGDEVIVLGFPTGIQALLARTDEAFLEELQREPDLDFWGVARRLAAAGRIGPLATRGIVGQVSETAVVYDAETTSGGSGGPVLDLEGRVVAVNAAILPQFGGSNLGVPAAWAGRLLAAAPPGVTAEAEGPSAGEPPAGEALQPVAVQP